MSNVVELKFPDRNNSKHDRVAATLQNFSGNRRLDQELFRLKDNGELLNILETSKLCCGLDQLQAHQSFYDTVEHWLSFLHNINVFKFNY